MLFKLVPIPPAPPTAPNGVNLAAISGLWGNVAWVVAILACFALVGCAIKAWSDHRQGQDNEGLKKASVVLGACFGISVITGIVGAITNT